MRALDSVACTPWREPRNGAAGSGGGHLRQKVWTLEGVLSRRVRSTITFVCVLRSFSCSRMKRTWAALVVSSSSETTLLVLVLLLVLPAARMQCSSVDGSLRGSVRRSQGNHFSLCLRHGDHQPMVTQAGELAVI